MIDIDLQIKDKYLYVLTKKEIELYTNYIECEICRYILDTGNKIFSIKDVIDYKQWNHRYWHPIKQFIYDAWCKEYHKTKYNNWPFMQIYQEANKRINYTLSQLFKMAINNISNIKFDIVDLNKKWNHSYRMI